jgi:signal transduction histidine kinase
MAAEFPPGPIQMEASVSVSVAADFGDAIAARIVAEHRTIAQRWLERLIQLVPVDKHDVFPTDALLDHIPDLVREMAGYLRAPDELAIAANTGVVAKAQELGLLRHAQRASVHQVMQEYRILGNILTAFVHEETERMSSPIAPAQCIRVLQRLGDCVGVLLQATVDTFVGEYMAATDQHAKRLEAFNRMISHELRQPLGTLQYAVALLRTDGADNPTKRARVVDVIDRNVTRLIDITRTLESLSRARARDGGDTVDTVERQAVEPTTIAAEAARQLREMADARGVEIRVVPDPCMIVVDVARLELIFINLMSNAIKYSDQAKATRFVEVSLAPAEVEGEVAVIVRDNGIGIAVENVNAVFKQFFRAHPERDGELGVDGAGLGLSIVADCVQAIGGRITVESTVGIGTAFTIVLPQTAPDPPVANR